MKSYRELAEEQERRESSFLDSLSGDAGLKELFQFEAGLGHRQDEILFKLTTEIEDTKNALNQVEQLAQRLKKYLERLRKIYQTLSK
jgi:Tfp pilus assembly protein PilN